MYQEFFNNSVSIASVDAPWDKFVFKIKAYKYTLIPILGSNLRFRGQKLGYLSLIFVEAKFGLQQQFQRPSHSDLPIWKCPLGVMLKLGFHWTVTGNFALRGTFASLYEGF